MFSFKINYFNHKSELCDIVKKYDTDNVSVTRSRYCHQYALFYEALLKNKRHEQIAIAELGILEGASLRMWQEYFPNANIFAYEYNNNNFKKIYDTHRIVLNTLDVTNKDSIIYAFDNVNTQYNIIIDHTTQQFEDQIRVIENTYKYLKDGGILIIENICKSYSEKLYIERLSPILRNFQEHYFVEIEHENRMTDNNKLLILVKSPIIDVSKITIITPSYRIDKLDAVYKSIDFKYVDEWIIVYDGNRIAEIPHHFNNDKIKEYIHKSEGISGNPQRNFALTKVSNENTMLYYLDDDNIIHPSLYKILNFVDNTKMYTFNQENGLKGNTVQVNHIDTAMALIPYNSVKMCTWRKNLYNADGYYIKECYNICDHIFIDNALCYYNFLASNHG